MSGKLDQSLDQIMKDQPAGARGRRSTKPRRAATKAKAAIVAPTGGVQKRAPRAVPRAPALKSTIGESKIIVSNLPEDVTETQIKDYFGQTVGRIKKVLLTNGPNGRSRGVATIIFGDTTSGAQAAKKLDGVKVDNKAMKIEVVVGANQAASVPAPKTLADRMSQPKSAAKQNDKGRPKVNGAAATNGAVKGNAARGGKKPAKLGRPKKKTADELDAEMADYFQPTNGTAQPAATTTVADTGMVDEVL